MILFEKDTLFIKRQILKLAPVWKLREVTEEAQTLLGNTSRFGVYFFHDRSFSPWGIIAFGNIHFFRCKCFKLGLGGAMVSIDRHT